MTTGNDAHAAKIRDAKQRIARHDLLPCDHILLEHVPETFAESAIDVFAQFE